MNLNLLNHFKRRVDVILVLITSIAIITPFIGLIYFNYMNYYHIVGFGLLLCYLNNIHFYSIHNHLHNNIFSNKTLNNIYEIISSIPMFTQSEYLRYIHFEHHKYVNDKKIEGKTKDPISTYRYGKDDKEENFLSCVFISPIRDYFGLSFKYGICSINSNKLNLSKIKIQTYIKFIPLFIYLVNYKYFLFMILVLYFSTVLNAIVNYTEHHNVIDSNNPKKDSNSVYVFWYNFITLNNGYHQEHHYRPGAHWTDLPKIREQLR